MARKPVTAELAEPVETVEPVVEPAEPATGAPVAVKPITLGDVGYRDRPIDPKDLVGDANTVMVQAVRSFAGIEGDKGPASAPFPVSRQRYAELKANSLVEIVK